MNRLNLLKSISLWLVLILITCVDEDICPPYTPEDTPVTFKLQMPGTHAIAAATTGLTEEEENSINDLAILLFNTNAAGQQVCEYFFGELTPTAVSGSDNQEYTLTTRLPIGSFHLMLLANLPPNTLTDVGTVGKLRTDIESTLQFAMTATWDITNHEGFPMWGMSEGEINIPATPTNTGPILMLRMLARINISVTEDLQDFIKIKNIKLHNPSSRGQVIPAEANLDRTTTPGYIRAIAPTLPLNSASNPDPGLLTTPWEYTSADIEDEAYLNNTLYALEGYDPTGLQDDEYAWLEITAAYKGGEDKEYRVDFRQTASDGTRTPLPILRNHTYDITITGMNEIEEDLEVTVSAYSDADMSYISPDGQYQLKVNQSTFLFDREERDADSFNNTLEVYTNHEDGWKITRVTDPDNNHAEINIDDPNSWFQIDPSDREGPKDETTPVKLLLKKNETTSTRRADIHLQVGRLLDFVVQVIQGTDTELELYVEDQEGNPIGELFYYEYYGWDDGVNEHKPGDIRVRWSPKGGTYHCKVDIGVYGDAPFEFDSQSDRITPGTLSDPEGFRELSIYPKVFTEQEVSQKHGNPFLHRGMRVTFTVTDEQDATKSISKTLYLRHQHLAIIAKDIERDSRLENSYEFSVLSNTTWKLREVDDPGNIATVKPTKDRTGGNDIVNGDKFEYTLDSPGTQAIPGQGKAGRKLTLYFEDQQGLIPGDVPIDITATYNDPNCYILNPSGTQAQRTVNIPIRKLFWAWDIYAEKDLGTVTNSELQADVVWTAVYNKNDLNGTEQAYTIDTRIIPDANNILESMLEVIIPYNANIAGNAVVGVKRNGEWLYSWHIWITDYNPESGNEDDRFTLSADVMMNRNLGALEYNTLSAASTHGLFYQWGRKDPIRTSFLSTSQQVNAANNLGNALNNPNVFYRSPSGLEDWFTNQQNSSYQNPYLWNKRYNDKGIFDPCPQGWRLTGSDWDGAISNEWTNVVAYSRAGSVTDTQGRYLYIELRDGTMTPRDYSIFPFTGIITSAGVWEKHTYAGSDDTCFQIGMRTPTTDNPTEGNTVRRSHFGYILNAHITRAQATVIRCVKEK